MIERYQTPEMAAIWSLQNQYEQWRNVELAVCQAYCEMGKISKSDLEIIQAKAQFTVEKVAEFEAQTHHDLIAFVSTLAQSVGAQGRLIHMGLTSSDVVDTASSLRLVESFNLVIEKAQFFLRRLKALANQHRNTPCIGRSHGIHAEPTTFGLKLLSHYAAFVRGYETLMQAREEIRYGQISGAVGTYAHGSPQLEKRVCDLLGLKVEPISTQILPRDRHEMMMFALKRWATAIERLALEIRHLQRTEVLEVCEPFAKGQKGSSAMPHKKNPVKCERLCGLARMFRGYDLVADENVALWHERDMSHSSNERIIWADSFHLIHWMTLELTKIIENLDVDPERMKHNIQLTRGLIYSQQILLALVDQKFSREGAYALVQTAAMNTWKENGQFVDHLLALPDWPKNLDRDWILSHMKEEEYVRSVDQIFQRFEEEEHGQFI